MTAPKYSHSTYYATSEDNFQVKHYFKGGIIKEYILSPILVKPICTSKECVHMSKSGSNLFSGTKGAKSNPSPPKPSTPSTPNLTPAQKRNLTIERKINEIKSLIKNGHISDNDIKDNIPLLCDKKKTQVVRALKESGYIVEVKTSKKSRSGAVIIKVKNPSEKRNISQWQCSPGGGRHGNSPYMKISTTDQGIIKVINGKKSDYKSDNNEKANIYFKEND